MRGLTLTQPFATLVALKAKTIETRDWGTSYRGALLITAAKKFPADCRELCPLEPFGPVLGIETLHTGKAVAIATLIECFKFGATTEGYVRGRSKDGRLPPHEADFGDYAEGRHGFVLASIVRLPEPIPCRGMLGLWEVPAELQNAVYAQVGS